MNFAVRDGTKGQGSNCFNVALDLFAFGFHFPFTSGAVD